MGGKKSKALEQELMDDLLSEKTERVAPEEAQHKAHSQSAEDEVEVDDLSVGAADYGKTEVVKDGGSTVRIGAPAAPSAHTSPAIEAAAEDKVRASVGRFGAFRSSGPASSTEAALAQSESLRIAQQRLLEFEQEIERLRLQNEELAAAGETLRRRADELGAANQRREGDYQNAISTFNQEKEILTASKEALQREIEVLSRKNEELELRISSNIQKIRVRERELENRLELVKMESAALIRSKDELILELKRQIDQINLELTNYRSKNQELNRQSSDKQEMLRRTVKALRLALSMLEGEEDKGVPAAAPIPHRKAK